MKKSTFVLILTLVLAFGCTLGGTLAWLVDDSDPLKNTFKSKNINVELTETTTDYDMTPGFTIPKDPTVTVKANSEACWLFIKAEESNNLDDFLEYTIAAGWDALDKDNYPGIYYRSVDATTADTPFPVLQDNIATVKGTVTKDMMDALEADSSIEPTLTFTTYAVQKMKDNTTEFTALEAWKIANPDN